VGVHVAVITGSFPHKELFELNFNTKGWRKNLEDDYSPSSTKQVTEDYISAGAGPLNSIVLKVLKDEQMRHALGKCGGSGPKGTLVKFKRLLLLERYRQLKFGMMLQSCPKIAHIRCAKCQDGACSDVKQPTAAVEEHAHMLTLTDSQLTVASSAITKVPPCEDDSMPAQLVVTQAEAELINSAEHEFELKACVVDTNECAKQGDGFVMVDKDNVPSPDAKLDKFVVDTHGLEMYPMVLGSMFGVKPLGMDGINVMQKD